MICTACFADPNKSRNAGSESMSGSGPGKHVDRPGEVTRGPMVKSLVSKSLVSLVSKAPGLLRCSTPAHYLKKKKKDAVTGSDSTHPTRNSSCLGEKLKEIEQRAGSVL